jgi:6-phosphogluconolactonase
MQQRWTRRHFLGAAGLTLAAQTTRFAHATPLLDTHAYVAVQRPAKRSGIQVLRSLGGEWQEIQFIASAAPSVVLLSERQDLLFVAETRTRFEGLPAASVDTYRIDRRSHRLMHIATQRLGLASVMPHAMALSPDGSLLVVAAATGLYNVMPVTQDGLIGEVTAVRKELRLDEDSSAQMHFVGDNQVQVHDELGVRDYHCDRDGMRPLHASGLSTRSKRPDVPVLVTGQRSIALAHFA